MPTLRLKKVLLLLILALAAADSYATQVESARIRSFLEGLDAGDVPVVAGRKLNEPDRVSRVYRARNHAPLWLPGALLSEQVPNLVLAISQSVAHGFSAERYHRSVIERLMQASEDSSQLALEILLTDAFLSQALHRGQGAVFPPNLDAEWQVPQAEVDSVALLLETADQQQNVLQVLDVLWPVDDEYQRLLRRRAEIVALGGEATVQIASGPALRPGQASDRIVILKQRLMGPGDHSPLYDDKLLQDVIAYQRSAGLEPDGVVGENTLEMLNATRVSWIDRIDANLERWRWLPRKTPRTYLRVNIAAFVLQAVDNGEPALSMNVIVGQPYRRTPVFTETIKYLVLNPFWNVPYSIATKDKLPLLQNDAAAEARKGFEAKPNGSDKFFSVDAIDWAGVTRRNFDYLLRQRPGPGNALGRMKFMLPNPHAVYLHDTPSRELFARSERSFSSGCIRLEDPVRLARWLLSRERHPDSEKLEMRLASGDTQTIYFKEPMPTYLVYFTAFSLDDGGVTFRRDVYGRDKVLIQALRDQSP